MRKPLAIASLLAIAALPLTAASGATGTPQRSDETPPGLAKQLAKGTPGIQRAIVASQGSNSRLQDLPTSP